MKTEIESFRIIGIEVRTSNQNNQAEKDITKLWNRFFTEAISQKINNKVSDSIFSIYTDYDSDFTGNYTTILGYSVDSLEAIPDGLIGREFPRETFEVFTARGAMPNAVVETWKTIWNKDKELKRKYSYDFELYGEKCQQGEQSEVDIYIAI